jgi:sugar phosphate isomerase/epimerase
LVPGGARSPGAGSLRSSASGAHIHPGCQLNCWQRELDFRTPAWEKLDSGLAQLREAGYAGVEVPSWSVPDPGEGERLGEVCARHSVTLVSIHVGGPFFDDAAYEEQTLARVLPVAACAARAGARAVVVSNATMKGKVAGFGTEEGRRSETWRAQVKNVTDLARRLRDQGLETWFHNHDPHFEYDAWEMDSLLEADPETVRLCVDVGHASQTMPRERLLAWLDHNWARVGCLHYKDVAGPLGGPVVEALGDGDIDFGAISAIARAHTSDGWIVAELDVGRRHGREPQRSSLEDARRSFAVIRESLGGG